MPSFVRTQIEIHLSIAPKSLQEPSECIFEHLSRLLLKYSRTLAGIPLSFQVGGITPYGRILDDGSIYINTLTEWVVVKIAPGDRIDATDGMYMLTFPCEVDGDDDYHGCFKVKSIEKSSKIVGTSVLETDF